MTGPVSVPLEDFIQAVQAQLDTAQARMALKARNDRLPLTFAIKDISLDLRAHVEVQRGEIRIRPAAPADKEASVFHLVFTAITRPMIEENAVQFSAENDEDPGLDSLGDSLGEEERRRLEWIGVRTVSKLREIQSEGIERSIGRITNTNLSPDRIRAALARSSRPMVSDVEADNAPLDTSGLGRLRVRGRNLLREGRAPDVTIGGERVQVVRASEKELLLAPHRGQFAGAMRLAHDPEETEEVYFDAAPRPIDGPTGGDAA